MHVSFYKYAHKYMKHSVDFYVFWACTRFEARDVGSKQNRFPYDYALTSYISTPDIISHARICQWVQKLPWSNDGKLEIGLMSSVWRHCWYDDSVGTRQRILYDICRLQQPWKGTTLMVMLYIMLCCYYYILSSFRRNWVNVCMVYGCGVFPSMLG